jgi:hypothetical protein
VNALEDHQLAVRQELFNFTERALAAGKRLENEKAKSYMLYGVGRRLRMIWTAYSEVFDTVDADRIEPLPRDDMAAVSRDLNVIYINIRGALDNYAWAVFHQKGLGKGSKLQENEVGLFHKSFLKCSALAGLRPTIEAHSAWNRDFKSRRDPSAHRMPLYVPPAILNEKETERFNEIWQERLEAIQKGDFDTDTKLADEQSKLGRFSPHFVHDPAQGAFPIYKTIPDDVGTLIVIGTAIHADLTPPAS